jgi:ketosteroid isomerase-like protein
MEPNQAIVEEVLQAEREWVRAHQELDVAALDRLMAEDYTIIDSRGAVRGKVETLASYQSQTRNWESADSDEYDVRVYGDTAVIIGRWRARGSNAGEAFDYAARFMAVYVKRGGRWQIVADQSTPITPAQAGATIPLS